MSTQQIPDRETPRFTVSVQALIAVNVAIYYLQLVGILGTIDRAFAFSTHAFPAKWWTALTFMFVHGGFWNVAANMVALFLFGPRLEQAWGTRRFLRFYAFGALAGLIAFAAFVHNGSVLIASSAPVFAVAVAYAMLWPTDEVFILGIWPLRVWTAVLTLIATNLALGIYDGSPNPTGLHFEYLAHLAGAIGAWAFMRTPGAPSLEQLRQRVSRVPDAEDHPRPIPKSQPRARERDETDEIVQRSRAIVARRSAVSRSGGAKSSEPHDEVNRVLDKISATGIESLTPAERRTLEEMSKYLRDT
jgi:membrane associated rhomboid family serine protease